MDSPRLLVAAGLVWLDARTVLLQRRPPARPGEPGPLEFPGGKIERGESPVQALARELAEEWGESAARLRIGPIATVLHHVYPAPGPEVILCVYHVDGEPVHLDWPATLTAEPGFTLEAFALASLPIEAFLAADRSFAASLAAGHVSRPDFQREPEAARRRPAPARERAP